MKLPCNSVLFYPFVRRIWTQENGNVLEFSRFPAPRVCHSQILYWFVKHPGNLKYYTLGIVSSVLFMEAFSLKSMYHRMDTIQFGEGDWFHSFLLSLIICDSYACLSTAGNRGTLHFLLYFPWMCIVLNWPLV